MARTRECFDTGWKFYLGDPERAQVQEYMDDGWRTLDLPHDWSIEGAFSQDNPSGGDGGYLPGGTGWYRKHFRLPADSAGKHVIVEFDGVYMNSDVWVNGCHLGRHAYGYTSFYYDITGCIKEDEENILAVRVDNSQQPGSRWYSGSGIYRHTWLTVTDKLHVARWGTYVTTPLITKEKAIIHVRTKIANNYKDPVNAILSTTVYDKERNAAGSVDSLFHIPAEDTRDLIQSIELASPVLWSDKSPYLYAAHSRISVDGKAIDDSETSFGIRDIAFDCDRGFLLNGESVKLNGVCLHHDGGCVGAAVPERVWERRLEMLRAMGCNAIRTSHNPPAPEFLDLCDRMGFLVMDEAFDEWRIGKEKNYIKGSGGNACFGYYQYFDQNSGEDMASMVQRDRNHPSVVLWSIGNEIPDLMYTEGAEALKLLRDICHREDPSRPVTCANVYYKHKPVGTPPEFLELQDVVGFNYVDRWGARSETYYWEDKQKYPHWKMVGSENGSMGGTRGEYRLKDAASGEWKNYYGINVEQLWRFTKIHDYVAGDFMWTGIDYLGECKWPKKSAECGTMDLCAFPKDSYYFYQSQWTKEPMVHVFPHWNWEGREGEVIPVLCYTNCDTVELFLNGKSFGTKAYQLPRPGMSDAYEQYNQPIVNLTTADLHLAWDIPYEPGILKVAGKRGGEVAAVMEVVTAGTPYKVEIIPDRSLISDRPGDVSHLTVRILDDKGRMVPTASNHVVFTVEGEGEILGVDNGKPDSHESFNARERDAFNGMCLAIVKPGCGKGEFKVTASSPGLIPGTVTIRCESVCKCQGTVP